MRRATRTAAWTLGLALVSLMQAASHAQQQDPKQAAPPVFRTGINYVRVDVIVSDKSGANVADLKASDFEVTEDGKPQSIDNFKFIKLDGGRVPDADGGLPRAIRTDADEEQEAARDDVRLFAIFFDDYHVRRENSIRVRAPLQQFVKTQLGPSDMIGVMQPLDPAIGVRMTRAQDRVVRAIDQFTGRKYDYRALNDIEKQYEEYPVETQEQIRVRVSLSAIQALIVHMGVLKEGRKQLIIVSEGFSNTLPLAIQQANPTGGNSGTLAAALAANLSGTNFAALNDMEELLKEVYAEANKYNVSLYPVDPRGLAVTEFGLADGNVGMREDREYLSQTIDTLRTLAVETDGHAVTNTNDLVIGMKQIVRDVSAYYLLGYDSTRTTADGKFHDIKVRVKRPGVQVRARKGYWALTKEEMALSTAPPKPQAPKAVTAALASVVNTSSASKSRSIRTWVGTSRGENGRTRVTFVWDPMPRLPGAPPVPEGQQPSRVLVTAVGADATPLFRERVPGGRAVFEVPPGAMQLRLAVEGASAGVIDSEIRDLVIPDLTKTQTSLGTPAMYRARTPRELQQMKADAQAVPATAREFSRTDRIFVRVEAYGAGAPVVTAHMLNRAGQPMSELVVTPPVAPSTEAVIDLPLASVAPGDYVIEITATGEGGEAKELVGFHVTS